MQKAPVFTFMVRRMPFSLFLDEILNTTTKHLGKAVNGFHTGLVDIFVSLFIHLDRSKADTGAFGQLSLGAAVGGSDAFEIGF